MHSLGCSSRGPVHPGAPGGLLGVAPANILVVGQERRQCDETVGADGKVGVLGEGIVLRHHRITFDAGDNFFGKDQVAPRLVPRRGEGGGYQIWCAGTGNGGAVFVGAVAIGNVACAECHTECELGLRMIRQLSGMASAANDYRPFA